MCSRAAGLSSRARLRLVKGSHIVVPRLYDGDQAYLLQNDDRRIVFVMPFERDWSLVGTTELPFAGDPGARRNQRRGDRLSMPCRRALVQGPPRPADVVWSYTGVRPLYEDRARSAAAVSRDYVFELDAEGPPALSIFGGKLTTHRRLAEHALAKLAPYLPAAGRRGPLVRYCPAATPCRQAASPRSPATSCGATRFSTRRPATGSPAVTAAMPTGSWERHKMPQRLAAPSAKASARPNCAGWSSTNGRAPQPTSCGAGASSACV